MFKTIEWTPEGVRMLDQRKLPREEVYVTCHNYGEVAEAIRNMTIRGAPAIGVAAAMGAALAVKQSTAQTFQELCADFEAAASAISKTRPTAVNLFWALERMRATLFAPPEGTATEAEKVRTGKQRLEKEAERVLAEDVAVNRAIGDHGATLLKQSMTVLTHCNAGALATAGFGTALGVIRAGVAQGKQIRVFADETRPFLQGARLTAWELAQDGIPVTLITDSMAGHFMKQGLLQAAIVGADRIAANGDVANKIGTYAVAVLARENNIPFYVAAPLSTVDLSIPSGDQIPIEERSQEEVTHLSGIAIAPAEVGARHPAFDVTPHRYVTAIITERGIARAPYSGGLRALFDAGR